MTQNLKCCARLSCLSPIVNIYAVFDFAIPINSSRMVTINGEANIILKGIQLTI